MCRKCVKKEVPERGSTCLDGGSYLLNFNFCVECNNKGLIKITNKTKMEDNDGVEEITFDHECSSCGHVIAHHEYTFKVEGGYQEYEMVCCLCGSGTDSRSVLPVDDRMNNPVF